jgi:hypothetical protein
MKTNETSPLYVYSMCFVQKMHNKILFLHKDWISSLRLHKIFWLKSFHPVERAFAQNLIILSYFNLTALNIFSSFK